MEYHMAKLMALTKGSLFSRDDNILIETGTVMHNVYM